MDDEKEKLRKEWENEYGVEKVFDTKQLTEQFNIDSFLAPYCYGREKSTGNLATFIFNHRPRLYRRIN